MLNKKKCSPSFNLSSLICKKVYAVYCSLDSMNRHIFHIAQFKRNIISKVSHLLCERKIYNR